MKEKGQKIVVIGGSFNPPTVAHFKLMKAAIDAIDAGIGSVEQWRGENLLGCALMEVRDWLRNS